MFLGGKITYKNDNRGILLKSFADEIFNISIEYPLYSYHLVIIDSGADSAEKYHKTIQQASQVNNATVSINEEEYTVSLFSLFIASNDLNEQTNFFNFISNLLNGKIEATKSHIDVLSLPISINVQDSQAVILTEKHNALLWMSTSSSDFRNIAESDSGSQRAQYFMGNSVLINLDRLEALLESFFNSFPSISKEEVRIKIVLNLLSQLIRYTNSKIDIDLSNVNKKYIIDELLSSLGVPANIRNKIYDLVSSSAMDLFDFPVSFDVQIDEVKGMLKLEGDTQHQFLKRDFSAIDLEMTFDMSVSMRETTRRITQGFSWDRVSDSDIANNQVSFSFGGILSRVIVGDVVISAKGSVGEVLWQKDFSAYDRTLQDLLIQIPINTFLNGSFPSSDHVMPKKEKIHGKVIELSGKCNVGKVIVCIEAKADHNDKWRIVSSSVTDSVGNFSLPYPSGNYSEARAIVSLAPNSPVKVEACSDKNAKESISNDFLYLVLKDIKCDNEESSCDCKDIKKTARLPDYEDLLGSDSYTQDIGASCINLSTPNRTLHEYSSQAIVRTSDPDVANYQLLKEEEHFILRFSPQQSNRKTVSLNNPIRWVDDIRTNIDHGRLKYPSSVSQAVTVATGHILNYKTIIKADGYSLGELLYSLPLAPGQEKEIVVLEQTHTLKGTEGQSISQSETLAASLMQDRTIVDQLTGGITESVRGSSSAKTWGINASLGMSGIIAGPIAGVLGVSGGYSKSSSSAAQDSSRNISQSFSEKIKNSLVQNAQSYRELNASIVTTVEQGQKYGVTSEVVANHNHCHAMTMMYFEVLRHYAVYHELASVEECLFIPLLLTSFSMENVYKWRDVLASNLLPIPSESYLLTKDKSGRHPLNAGFDAIERRLTSYANVDWPEKSYAEDQILSITGTLKVRVNLVRPLSRYDRIKSFSQVTVISEVKGYQDWIITKVNLDVTLIKSDKYIMVEPNFKKVPPRDCIRIIEFDDHFFEDNDPSREVWQSYADILYAGKLIDMLKNYFGGRLISEWDGIFYRELIPGVLQSLIDQDRLSMGESINVISLSIGQKYQGGEQFISLNFRGSTTKSRNEITELKIHLSAPANLTSGLNKLILESLFVNYMTSHYRGVLINEYIGISLTENIPVLTPLNENEKRNPRKEDDYVAKRLLEHLNSNVEYYNNVIFRNIDEYKLYMLLDGFSIQLYDNNDQPTAHRSLASVVKNELITVVGNSLVFPVAPGYKVSRSNAILVEGDEVKLVDLFERYKPLTPTPPYRISIPTKGVFAEAIQGACNACERVQENTSQDWDKFKTDKPTSINPITVPTPTISDWRADFKDFSAPLVNIQNPLVQPNPGAGLAGLNELLGKSDIFKDITGLTENQKNALAVYLSNQENSKAFASMAKEMRMQDHNTNHSREIAEAIRNSPELSKEDKAQLLKDHYKQMIDGGQSSKISQQKEKQEHNSLSGAAVKAIGQGKDVKASKADAEGNIESIEVKTGKTTSVLAVIDREKDLPSIKQKNDNACWATAATIMMSWRKGKTLKVEDVLLIAGQEYLDMFNRGEGLKSQDKELFISKLNMRGEAPASYPLDQYIHWIRSYGPLWVTVDSASAEGRFSPHAKILFKIIGSGSQDTESANFVFIDPTSGKETTQSFNDFLNQYEQMVTDNEGGLYIQIVHFSESHNDLGEGKSHQLTAEDRMTQELINYKPSSERSVVINKFEVEWGGNLLNWANQNIPHNKISQGNRSASDIKHLVLHETASPVESEGTANGISLERGTTSHIAIKRDGYILQFNDLVQKESHSKGLNTTAIGVEFVNRGWLSSKRKEKIDNAGDRVIDLAHDFEAIPAKENKLTDAQKQKYPDGNDYLYCFWGDGFNVYRLPNNITQLESLVDLVRWITVDISNLIAIYQAVGWLASNPSIQKLASLLKIDLSSRELPKLDLFTIKNNWLQVVAYDDVNAIWEFNSNDLPKDADRNKKMFFVFTTGFGLLEPHLIREKVGIVAHNAFYEGHSDGSFLALYTWLRIEKNIDVNKAFELTKRLMKNNHFSVGSDQGKIHLIKVDDLSLSTLM